MAIPLRRFLEPAGSRPAGRSRQDKVVPLRRPEKVAPVALVRLYRLSQGVTAVAGLTVLGLYGWFAHRQTVWQQQYRHLAQLERQERELTLAQTALKTHFVQEGRSRVTGLVPPRPNTQVFLTPAAPRAWTAPTRRPAAPLGTGGY